MIAKCFHLQSKQPTCTNRPVAWSKSGKREAHKIRKKQVGEGTHVAG